MQTRHSQPLHAGDPLSGSVLGYSLDAQHGKEDFALAPQSLEQIEHQIDIRGSISWSFVLVRYHGIFLPVSLTE